MTINSPVFDKSLGMQSGIYKIIFPTGHFYIGASSDLRNRVFYWRGVLVSKKYGNQKIKSVAVNSDHVDIIIIEKCPIKALNKKENDYLLKYSGDSLFLNIRQTSNLYFPKGKTGDCVRINWGVYSEAKKYCKENNVSLGSFFSDAAAEKLALLTKRKKKK